LRQPEREKLMTILICVTDAQLFLLLRHILTNDGFDAMLYTEIDELERFADGTSATALIVDLIKPGLDTDALVAQARCRFPDAGVICLDRRDLGEGAPSCLYDLRLESPFNPGILLSYLRRMRYRLLKKKDEDAGRVLRFADLSMDIAAVKVKRADQQVALTALEFRLLRRLLLHPSVVCEREDLIEACWPDSAEVEPRTVDVHIGHIRRALMSAGPDDLIRTVRGRGYALQVPS
jgi:two-component system phosphate regulon response regulator PhoB